MAPLRESERKEEIRVLHMEIWDKMQSFDESYAESYYKICLKNLGKEEKEFFGPSLNMNSVDTDFLNQKVLDCRFCWSTNNRTSCFYSVVFFTRRIRDLDCSLLISVVLKLPFTLFTFSSTQQPKCSNSLLP